MVFFCAVSAALLCTSGPALAQSPAVVNNTSAANVGIATATLYALINPGGSDTAYRFEYGTTTDYGSTAPASGIDIGGGEGDVPGNQAISGLQENTVYHFRVAASNSFGNVYGPDRTFMTGISPGKCPNAAERTGPSAHLPDCRAYEQVTPTEKKGASQDLLFDKSGFEAEAIASSDGDRVALAADGVTFGPNPLPEGSITFLERAASGWITQEVNPPSSGGDQYNDDILLNPELTQVAVKTNTTPYPPPNEIFSVGPPGGPLTAFAAVPFEGGALRVASSDLSSIVIESTDHNLLAGGASTDTDASAHDLYQWSNGQISLVNRTSSGGLVSPCGARLPWSSSDGSEVLFQSPDENESGELGCQEVPQLYARVDGRETVEISAPEPGVVDPDGPQAERLVGVSEDGSKIFFSTTAELTTDDLGNHEEQIYEYDMSTRKLTRITAAVGGIGSGFADAFNWSLASRDGSAIYYRDQNNQDVYRYTTAAGTTQLIATVAEPSFQLESPNGVIPGHEEDDATTPDGRFLIFESKSVSGFPSDRGEDELYRYDSADSSVVCVSCPPNNKAGDGGAYFNRSSLFTEDRTPHYLAITDDGSEVFFQSDDHLVPQDVNQIGGSYTAPGSDVYEWHNGTVSLISSGNDEHAAVFLGVTPDGSNAFFSTHSQLVPQDTDSLDDIYDARVDGGFPVASEATPCTGDACHNPAPEPNDATPSSSTFSGPGNPAPLAATQKSKLKSKAKSRACPKGKVRKKGRCVKKAKARKAARRAAARKKAGSK